MYIRTFAIGFPIPAFLFSSSPPFSSTPSSPPPLTLASLLAQLLASVGPYALISTRPLLHFSLSLSPAPQHPRCHRHMRDPLLLYLLPHPLPFHHFLPLHHIQPRSLAQR